MPRLRVDGRGQNELRELNATLGQLDRADGSAQFGFGGTSALASVSGPIEAGLREEMPDKATFRIVHRPLEGVGATPSKALINTLQAVFPSLLALGQHPRSLIQLVIQSLSPDPTSKPTPSYSTQNTWPPEEYPQRMDIAPITGSYFSARASALNAASLALIDGASIAIRAVPISVALVLNQDGFILVDPVMEEEESALARFVFGWAFGNGISSVENKAQGGMDVDGEVLQEVELVWAESEGNFTKQQYELALKAGKEAATEILTFYRDTVSDHLSSRLKLRNGQ